MTSVRSGHAAKVLRGGRVLLAGGFDDEAPVRTAELYDPATGRFERTGSLTAPAAAPRPHSFDGRVLIAGGYDQSITPTARSFLYRP